MILSENSSPPLVRPAMIKDEWWTGFVGRVLGANGVRPIPNFGMVAFEESVSLLVSHRKIQSHEVGTEGYFGLRRFGRYLLPRQFVRSRYCSMPICHQCFAESNHIPMSWRLRTTFVCQKHNKLLNDKCPCCGLRWNIAVAYVGRCPCGFDLRCTDHQTCAEPQHLVGAATDFDASVFYNPTQYVTECVMSDLNSRKLAFASLWAYALMRLKDADVNAYAGTRICALLESQHFAFHKGLGELSVWQFLSEDQLIPAQLTKLATVLKQTISNAGHAFGLLGALPINNWISEIEWRVGSLNAPIDLNNPKIKNIPLARRFLESGLEALSRHHPELLITDIDQLKTFHFLLSSLAMPKLPLSGKFVSFTSTEMSHDILAQAFPKLWDGILLGSIWIYTNYQSSGFSRFYLDRATYWKWRGDANVVCHFCNPKQYVRDMYGYANLVGQETRRPPKRSSHRPIRGRKTIARRMDQVPLFE